MATPGQHAEPAMALAKARFEQNELSAAHDAALAARSYLELFAPPDYRMYDPQKLLKRHEDTLANERTLLDLRATGDCPGDQNMVWTCLRALVKCAVLESDAILAVESYVDGDTPVVALTFDGPGAFPNEVLVQGMIPLPMPELFARWTAATRGGRVDRTVNGLMLRLKGVRVVPDADASLVPLVEQVRAAEQHLRLALSEEGGGTACAALDALEEGLLIVDGGARDKTPGDLGTAIEQAVQDKKAALDAASIAVETYIEAHVPPIAMHRKSVVSAFMGVFEYARAVLPRGGAVAILAEYDTGARAVTVAVSIAGTQCRHGDSAWLAGVRRGVIEVNGGTLHVSEGKDTVTLTVTLPDSVGKDLDRWLPGFDAFSSRSRQMLRLLKSGGPTPPAEFLLDGVLEEELERWLLPRLERPQAQNVAHDAPVENKGLAGTSAERLAKALAQVKKGKPRKEVAKPGYAAELLWSFNQSERGRGALAVPATASEYVDRLSQLLLRDPIQHDECLRVLAQILNLIKEGDSQ